MNACPECGLEGGWHTRECPTWLALPVPAPEHNFVVRLGQALTQLRQERADLMACFHQRLYALAGALRTADLEVAQHHLDQALQTLGLPGIAASGRHLGELSLPVGRTLVEVQRRYILLTLSACRGNRKAAAKLLGVPRRTLYEYLAQAEADGAAVPPAQGGGDVRSAG